MTERKKTKRKVDLVSSHSDNEHDNGPLAAYSLEGSAVSDLYKNDDIPAALCYIPRDTSLRRNLYSRRRLTIFQRLTS